MRMTILTRTWTASETSMVSCQTQIQTVIPTTTIATMTRVVMTVKIVVVAKEEATNVTAAT